jgi:hypothetical protein
VLADLDSRERAFPPEAIKKPPSGRFAWAERDRRHVLSIYSSNEKNNTINAKLRPNDESVAA